MTPPASPIWGFTRESLRAMVAPMETLLDDLARVLKAPQPGLRDRYGAFLLQLLGNVATGLAVGLGFAIGHAIAG